MKKRIRVVFFVCIFTVVIFTSWSMVRTLRPSGGKAYEQLSVEEAKEYMSFESAYCIVDVREASDYEKGHVENAVHLPLKEVVERADEVIPDRGMMIYVYGYDSNDSCQAAQKLSDMGFTSVTETGSYTEWVRLAE